MKINLLPSCLLFFIISSSLLIGERVEGWAVSPPKSFSQLEAEAGLVIKAEVLTTKVLSARTEACERNLADAETRLKVISVLKGNPAGEEITIKHLTNSLQLPESLGLTAVTSFCRGPVPQQYSFEVGRSYIIFLEQKTGGWAPLSDSFSSVQKVDNFAAFLSLNSSQLPALSVAEAVQNQLTELARAGTDTEVAYSLTTLKGLAENSSPSWPGLSSMDEVASIAESVLKPGSSPDVARAALEVLCYQAGFGAQSVRLENGNSDSLRLLDSRTTNALQPPENKIGKRYSAALLHYISQEKNDLQKAQALLCLSRVGSNEVRDEIVKAAKSDSPKLRGAAAYLSIEFPEGEGILRILARDRDDFVRQTAFYAIALGRYSNLAPILAEAMGDGSKFSLVCLKRYLGLRTTDNATQAAACALTMFDPIPIPVQHIMESNLSDCRYGNLFLLALAENFRGQYLNELATLAGTTDSETNCSYQTLSSQAQRLLQEQRMSGH